jgi:azurin
VNLTGTDTMQYDKKTFTVEVGKKVKLTFKNIGTLPKAAMGHNVVILKKGSNKITYAVAAISAGPASDYMPAAMKDQVLANTKLLGPGEEESIIFTVPEKGSYEYLCTFPGHFALMSGTMLVK